MGLADIFTSSSSNPPPVPPKNADDLQMAVDRDKEKDEIIRRLTEELMRTRERNQQLEKDRPAIEAAKAAVERAREIEDVLRLKDGMMEALERQVALLEKHNASLQQKEAELVALRAEQAEHPISHPDLLHRYEQLCDIFGQLRDTLSCPVCYEPFDKDQAVSLLCGHSFCATCYAEWERKHIEAFKLSPRQGQYTGPECPECRTADVRRGRVRIWSLEEVVRLVDRANREIANKPHTPAVPPVEPLTATELLLADESTVKNGGVPLTPVSDCVKTVDDLISFEAETEAAGEKEKVVQPAPCTAEADEPAMDVDSQASTDTPDSLADAPAPSSPLRLATDETPRTPSPPLPPAPSTPASPTRASLEQQYLVERALARARAREEEARLEAEAAARRAEEDEREAREAREQVLSERRRMPYEAVFR
ncbi:hypothetical protein JCM10295v2_000900 [Rhodotorula toruloides]